MKLALIFGCVFFLSACSDHSNVVDPGADESIAGWFRKETSGTSSATSGTSSAVGTSSTTSGTSSVAASSSSSQATSSAATSSASASTLNTQTCTYSASGTSDGSTGTLTCSVENKIYATVVIGTQTWMAENLKFATASGSWCKSDASTSVVTTNTSYCDTYGRVYDYTTALTVCPTGWHLPTDGEWTTLETYLGASTACTQLKSTSALWASGGIAGANTSKFSALPGGNYTGGSFVGVGNYGYWWAATPSGRSSAYSRSMIYYNATVDRYSDDQGNGFSVRCLKD